jgi:hypothetical protein
MTVIAADTVSWQTTLLDVWCAQEEQNGRDVDFAREIVRNLRAIDERRAPLHAVTTDETLTRDLRKSLAARKSIQTVGDFLNALMAHGVTLDTPLASIEFGIALTGNGLLDIAYEDGVIDIREGTAK